MTSALVWPDRLSGLRPEEAEDGYTRWGSYVDLAVYDQRGNELVPVAEGVASSRGLPAVVELVTEIRGVVRMEHSGRSGARLERPDDSVLCSIGGDRGRGS